MILLDNNLMEQIDSIFYYDFDKREMFSEFDIPYDINAFCESLNRACFLRDYNGIDEYSLDLFIIMGECDVVTGQPISE